MKEMKLVCFAVYVAFQVGSISPVIRTREYEKHKLISLGSYAL